MGSTDKNNEKDEKNSVEFLYLNLQQAIPEIIHQSLQGVRENIQIVQESNTDLRLMMHGMHAEIQELKKATKSIGYRLDKLFDVGVIKKAAKPHVKEISTGLDFLTQIPQHLRDTFETILKQDKGSTALQVSIETGKSRSLESDYLNQLVDRGFVIKKRDGKKVLFFKTDEEEEAKLLDPNGSLAFIAEKQNVVNNAKNSHGKKTIIIKSNNK